VVDNSTRIQPLRTEAALLYRLGGRLRVCSGNSSRTIRRRSSSRPILLPLRRKKVAQENRCSVIRQSPALLQAIDAEDHVSQRQQESQEIGTNIPRRRRSSARHGEPSCRYSEPLVRAPASKVDLLKGAQEVQNYQSESRTRRASLPARSALLAGSANQDERAVATFSLKRPRTRQATADLSTVTESMQRAQATVGRTELRSPFKGTVRRSRRAPSAASSSRRLHQEIVPIEDHLFGSRRKLGHRPWL